MGILATPYRGNREIVENYPVDSSHGATPVEEGIFVMLNANSEVIASDGKKSIGLAGQIINGKQSVFITARSIIVKSKSAVINVKANDYIYIASDGTATNVMPDADAVSVGICLHNDLRSGDKNYTGTVVDNTIMINLTQPTLLRNKGTTTDLSKYYNKTEVDAELAKKADKIKKGVN